MKTIKPVRPTCLSKIKFHFFCKKFKSCTIAKFTCPFQSKPSFQEVYVFGLWWIDELSKDSKADNPDFLDILTKRWFKKSAVQTQNLHLRITTS